MASREAVVAYILDQIGGAGDVSSRKMFGEYAIYHGEKIVALVCDDQLYVKPTDAGKAFIGKYEEAPPYPSAKNHLLISGEKWDDGEWLSRLLAITAADLPAPTKKKKR